MRISPFPIALLLLSGCGGVAEYNPYIVDISQPQTLVDDKRDCLGYALGYKPGLNGSAISSAAAQGAASNLAGAAVSPLVPVLGAAGGAGGEFLTEMGLLTTAQRRVFLICLSHRGERSRAYNVIDPNQ